MKKTIKFAGLTIASVFLLAGCSSKPAKEKAPEEAAFAQHCEYATGVRAPQWYCDPSMEGGIAAVGEAKPNPAGDRNLQRTVAMGNARDELARQMELQVKNMLENWARTTGTGDAQTYEANIENVSRQVSQQTLQGSTQIGRWVAPDGTLVLLVGMREQTKIEQNIKTSLRNENALWQQFQSKQALDSLDQEIAKTFGGAN